MRIGIIELMDTSHVVLVETFCRIFCFDRRNNVFLFTTDKYSEYFNFLSKQYSNLSLIIKPHQQSHDSFLIQIDSVHLDRLYIVTLTKYFSNFSRWKVKARMFLVIHNLDEWFSLSLFQSVKKIFYYIYHSRRLDSSFFFFKSYLIYPVFKKRILKNLSKNNGCLVVLSEALRQEFTRLKVKMPIVVVPFAVYDPSFPFVEPSAGKELRICVPGTLSQYRRNYLALLDLIEKQLGSYKNRLIFDFLGGIQSDNQMNDTREILEKVNHLNNNGFKIIVHHIELIPPLEYDTELSQADIILGNMNVVLNKFSVYGKTKETGLPFAMIKAAKPGILPYNYPVPVEIASSTLLYNDFSDLGGIIINLINDPEALMELKNRALVNSKYFSTEIIYNKLVAETCNTRPLTKK
jgi:hypothetical protein